MGRKRTVEIIGNRYNYLQVVARDEEDHTKFFCLCDCGNITSTTKQRLDSGSSKSCGCMKSKLTGDACRTHGAASNGKNTPTYQSFIAMNHRCFNDTRFGWERYGGRGITISEETWLEPSPNGFLNFLQDMGERPAGTSLDRVDSNGNYNKENCRWSNRRIQSYNSERPKRNNSTSKYRGVSLRVSTGKWMARIGNGKGGYEFLGDFITEESAALAYNRMAVEIHGSDAILNDVDVAQC